VDDKFVLYGLLLSEQLIIPAKSVFHHVIIHQWYGSMCGPFNRKEQIVHYRPRC